jgi:hypothetical protein
VGEEAVYTTMPRPTAATNAKAAALLEKVVAVAAESEELLVGALDSSLEVEEGEAVVVVEGVVVTELVTTVLVAQ